MGSMILRDFLRTFGVIAALCILVGISAWLVKMINILDDPFAKIAALTILVLWIPYEFVGMYRLGQFGEEKSPKSTIEQTETYETETYETTGVVTKAYEETETVGAGRTITICHTIIQCDSSYYDVTDDFVYNIFGTEGTKINLTLEKIKFENDSTLYRVTSINNIECKSVLVQMVNQTK